MLFIKNHISGGRTAEARMELGAGATVEEIESKRIGLHVLEAAGSGGVDLKLCLTPCQADRSPQT